MTPRVTDRNEKGRGERDPGGLRPRSSIPSCGKLAEDPDPGPADHGQLVPPPPEGSPQLADLERVQAAPLTVNAHAYLCRTPLVGAAGPAFRVAGVAVPPTIAPQA
jgi:hypothetical protein